jgi:hypothetical protein
MGINDMSLQDALQPTLPSGSTVYGICIVLGMYVCNQGRPKRDEYGVPGPKCVQGARIYNTVQQK